jgi:hypothetical protein
MEKLPDPRSTPITPETVANLDPKIQEILLRHANEAEVNANKIPIDSKMMADAARHAKHIESTLPPEDDN